MPIVFPCPHLRPEDWGVVKRALIYARKYSKDDEMQERLDDLIDAVSDAAEAGNLFRTRAKEAARLYRVRKEHLQNMKNGVTALQERSL